MKAPLSYVPMLPAAVGMVIGILLETALPIWLLVATGVTAFALFYWKGRHYPSFFFLLTVAGALLAAAHKPIAPSAGLYDGDHTFEARINQVNTTDHGMSMMADISLADGKEVSPIKCMLYLRTYDAQLVDGYHVRFDGHLSPLPQPSVVPYSFDYGEYLRSLGVSAIVYATTGTVTSEPSQWQRLVNRCRDEMYDAIADLDVSGDCAAFLLATILGERQYIDSSTTQEYRITGVSHMLALSGLHVGILASLLAFVLLPLQFVRKGYMARAIAVIVLIWIYAVIVGLPDSVMRAAVMITVMMLSLIIQRGYYPLNALCTACVVVLAVSPLSLYRPGFQMSFASVAAILSVNALVPRNAKQHRCYRVAAFFGMPVAAMLGTGIIAAYHYHIFPGSFLLANVVVGLLFPVILSLGYIDMVCCLLGVDFFALSWVVNGAYDVMRWAIGQMSNWRFLSAETYFSPWVFVPYYATIALIFIAIARRQRVWAIYAALTAALTVLLGVVHADAPGHELYIPSEQANCIVMRTDNRAYILPLNELQGPAIAIQGSQRYSNYLSLRHCGDCFTAIQDSLCDAPFVYDHGVLVTPYGAIVAVGAHTCDSISVCHSRYAIVTPTFTDHISKIIETLHPDTIMISAGVAPGRLRRLKRECPADIPMVMLRDHPVSLKPGQ